MENAKQNNWHQNKLNKCLQESLASLLSDFFLRNDFLSCLVIKNLNGMPILENTMLYYISVASLLRLSTHLPTPCVFLRY